MLEEIVEGWWKTEKMLGGWWSDRVWMECWEGGGMIGNKDGMMKDGER